MVTIEHALEDFLLSTRESLSARTTEWYEGNLRDVVDKLRGTMIDEVPTLAIRQYLVALRETPTHYVGGHQVKGGVSHETLRGRHRAMKRFFNWCVLEYDLDPLHNPMRKIKTPGPTGQPPKAVSMDDVRKMIAAAGMGPIGIRDRAILFFLLDTGCRAGGLLSLTPENLVINELRAMLTEKGDRARFVPFTPDTAALLRQWMEVRPANATTVFCRFGTVEAKVGEPLTIYGLRQILRRLALRGGVEGRFNPHAFRHGNAREFLRNGGNMAALQQLLGHSNPNVTMSFYARFNIKELAEQQAQFSPVKNLK